MAPKGKIPPVSLLGTPKTDFNNYASTQVNDEDNKKKIPCVWTANVGHVKPNNVFGQAKAAERTASHGF